jgi:hypothetical protein
MKMIQKISSITAVTLLLSILVSISSAFADDAVAPASSLIVTASTVTSSTYDDNLGQFDALYNQILSLRQQDKDLEVQMKAQHDQNSAAIKAINAQVSSNDLAQIKAVRDQNKTLRDANKALYDQWSSLSKKLKNAMAAKDEKLSAEIRLQLNEVKKQLKPIQDQMKANEASIKNQITTVNMARKKIHDLLSPLKPIEQQMKSLWGTEPTLQQQREAGWKAFNDAVKNGDIQGAIQALTQIVTAKQQILETRKQIYSLEQQEGSALGTQQQ